MLGRLASLFVEIKADSGPLESGLSRIHGQLGQMASSFGAMAAQAAVAFGAMAAGAAALGLYKAVNAAGDLNEAIDKVDSVFGEAGQAIKDFADDYAKRFGVVKKVSLDAAASIGLLGTAAGMSDREAAELGAKFSKIAADITSLHNMPFEAALDKLKSGLAGEARPLREIGVFLSEDAVAAKALAMGLASSAKEAQNLSDQQKLLVRIKLIEDAPAEEGRGEP